MKHNILFLIAALVLFVNVTLSTPDSEIVDVGVLACVPVIAVDSTNDPHVISYETENLGVRYAVRRNGSWQTETVDSEGNVGDGHDIAIDQDGVPHISYRDITNGGVKYAKKVNGSWETETLDDPVDDYVEASSIAIDSNGNPHVAYGVSFSASLGYAWWNGSSWSIETPGVYSYFISLDLDADDNAHIATLNQTGSEVYHVKHVTRFSNGSWEGEIVDNSTPVRYDPLIAVDSGSRPHLAYRGDSDTCPIKYASWNGTSWNVQTVDYAEVCEIGEGAQLDFALDKDDKPYLVYALPGEGLKLATMDGGEWTFRVVGPSRVCSIAADQLNRAHIAHTYEADDGEIIKYVLVETGETTCNSCEDCSAKLNGDYDVVKLAVDIANHSGTCINNPENFTNKIFDCQGHTISGSGANNGIYVTNHDNVTIKNCVVKNFTYGIYLGYPSSNNMLMNNTANNNTYGIFSSSSNNILTSNTANNNNEFGIFLGYSNNNTLTNNIASNNGDHGIRLYFSINNVLTYNIMENNGVYISGSDVSYFNTHNITGDNTVNGKPVRYLKDTSDTIVPSGAGQVILANVTNVTVENQDVSNASVGIEIAFSSECTIQNNIASNNIYGIFLHSSSNNTLTNNTADNNEIGIYLGFSSNNTLTNNTADNNEIGIYLDSSSNNTLNLNHLCFNTGSDFYPYSGSGNSGDENTCSNAGGWNDMGVIGCRYNCIPLGEPTCSSCYECRAKLNGDYGVVKLTEDIVNHYGTCIEFNTNNVEFDCQGHLIDGDDSGWDQGIYMNGKSGNKVKNCVVTGFRDGIYLTDSSNNTLTNNTANSNEDYGIRLWGSSSNTLTGNTANSNNYYGIYLWGYSNYNTLTDNTANSNNHSGILVYGSHNSLNSNHACYNTESDFYLLCCSGNSGDENTCDNPDDWNDEGATGCTYACSGECLKGDADCNGTVSDFELLAYVDQWVNGLVDDFDLLEAIDNWAG